ncbi:P2X purinoceptor 7 [Bombina bombina]|uniref:P2X purinoceptor 7 n=1 Tax=Bombina bombina TaxID=8345 RepID=UPI00235AC0C2|nr:P2X purinoceptor 7 [Bombina bombina]XP_053569271.1 P2X purinoceptor 7 [Bombina bombina]
MDQHLYEEKHPRSSVKKEDSSEAKVDPRLKNTEWCTCGNCILLPTLTESICCREVVEIASRIPDGASCVCDDPYVTKMLKDRKHLIFLYHFVLSDLPNPPEVARELSESEIRMLAYRAFSCWVYGNFGPENCEPIPSCFVSLIRQTFPSPDHKCNAHHDNPASEMGAVDFLY